MYKFLKSKIRDDFQKADLEGKADILFDYVVSYKEEQTNQDNLNKYMAQFIDKGNQMSIAKEAKKHEHWYQFYKAPWYTSYTFTISLLDQHQLQAGLEELKKFLQEAFGIDHEKISIIINEKQLKFSTSDSKKLLALDTWLFQMANQYPDQFHINNHHQSANTNSHMPNLGNG